jgi:hypothetical protein
LYAFLFWPYVLHAPLSYPTWLCNPNNNCWRVQIVKLPIMQVAPVPTTSSLSGTNILLRTLFSNTSLCFVLLAWETKFHTHRTQPVVCFNLYVFG